MCVEKHNKFSFFLWFDFSLSFGDILSCSPTEGWGLTHPLLSPEVVSVYKSEAKSMECKTGLGQRMTDLFSIHASLFPDGTPLFPRMVAMKELISKVSRKQQLKSSWHSSTFAVYAQFEKQ